MTIVHPCDNHLGFRTSLVPFKSIDLTADFVFRNSAVDNLALCRYLHVAFESKLIEKADQPHRVTCDRCLKEQKKEKKKKDGTDSAPKFVRSHDFDKGCRYFARDIFNPGTAEDFNLDGTREPKPEKIRESKPKSKKNPKLRRHKLNHFEFDDNELRSAQLPRNIFDVFEHMSELETDTHEKEPHETDTHETEMHATASDDSGDETDDPFTACFRYLHPSTKSDSDCESEADTEPDLEPPRERVASFQRLKTTLHDHPSLGRSLYGATVDSFSLDDQATLLKSGQPLIRAALNYQLNKQKRNLNGKFNQKCLEPL